MAGPSTAADSMDWFSLSLICALALATADALTKRLFADTGAAELLVVRFAVPGALLLPLALHNGLPPVPAAFWGWLGVLVPLELAAMAVYVTAIRDAPLHLTLPYLAFTPVFNVLTGYLVLGEEVSAAGFSGILLVTLGAYLLNLEHLGERGARLWLAPLAAVLRERGSRLMLAVAGIYSLTSVGGKAAMEYTTPWVFGPFYYGVIGATLAAGLLAGRPRTLAVVARRPLQAVAVGGLMAVMVVTHFLAVARVEVAYMVSVKRTSLLFGIVYGALLFGERGLARNLGAGLLMVAGVAVILIAG